MRRIGLLLLVACAWLGALSVPCFAASSPPPRLFFSDLMSGPRSGNSDTSLGQAAGLDGAIVSVWGAFLGKSQGDGSFDKTGRRLRRRTE